MSSTSLLSFLIGTIAFQSMAFAALDFRTSDLAMKDYEDMQKIVHNIQKSKNADLSVEESRRLKFEKIVKVIMARKDNDGARAKLYRSLRADLLEDESDVLSTVISEAVSGMKNDSSALSDKVTYFHILNNLVAEMRSDKETYKETLSQIRDAKIELSDRVSSSLALSGDKIVSPSDLAKQSLASSN